MSLRRKLVHATLMLLAGNAGARLFAMATSIQLAWLVSKEDFGIGATLWLASSLVSMLSEMGVDRMLVQADDGDDERLGAVAQSIFLLRGLTCGALLLALAYPTALLFNLPDITWAFALAALGPVIYGFRHRDTARVQRRLKFLPVTVTKVAPEVVACCLAYPAALWLKDFRVFLALSLGKCVLTCLTTHVMAERPYRLGWDPLIARRFFSFGWPVALNAALMYATIQGDRVIVGASFPLDKVGEYAIASALTLQAAMLINGIACSVGLPVFSQYKHSPARFTRFYSLSVCASVLSAGIFGAACIALGPLAIDVLYGAKYAPVAPVLTWLGVVQAVRLMRVAPTMAAMALGDTRNALATNAVKTVVFLAIWFLIVPHSSLTWLAIAATAGEVAASAAACSLLRERFAVPAGLSLAGMAVVGVLLSCLLVPSVRGGALPAEAPSLAAAAVTLCASFLLLGLAIVALSAEARSELGLVIRQVKGLLAKA